MYDHLASTAAADSAYQVFRTCAANRGLNDKEVEHLLNDEHYGRSVKAYAKLLVCASKAAKDPMTFLEEIKDMQRLTRGCGDSLDIAADIANSNIPDKDKLALHAALDDANTNCDIAKMAAERGDMGTAVSFGVKAAELLDKVFRRFIRLAPPGTTITADRDVNFKNAEGHKTRIGTPTSAPLPPPSAPLSPRPAPIPRPTTPPPNKPLPPRPYEPTPPPLPPRDAPQYTPHPPPGPPPQRTPHPPPGPPPPHARRVDDTAPQQQADAPMLGPKHGRLWRFFGRGEAIDALSIIIAIVIIVIIIAAIAYYFIEAAPKHGAAA